MKRILTWFMFYLLPGALPLFAQTYENVADTVNENFESIDLSELIVEGHKSTFTAGLDKKYTVGRCRSGRRGKTPRQ